MTSTALFDNNFDFTNASKQDVDFAFVVKMPFRFRSGSPFYSRFENQRRQFDLWIKNKPLGAAHASNWLPTFAAQGGKLERLGESFDRALQIDPDYVDAIEAKDDVGRAIKLLTESAAVDTIPPHK